MNRVLLLSENNAKKILYMASKGGHDIFVAGNPKKNRLVRHNPLCKRFIPLKNDLHYGVNTQALVDEIKGIIQQERIDILLPSSFDCIKIVSKHRQELKAICDIVPTPPLDVINELDNKNTFYEFCKRHDIAHPPSFFLKTVDQMMQMEAVPINFPVILKPVLGSAEEGLQVFNTIEEMKSFFENEENAMLLPALIQEYFSGEDIDFNGFAVNGTVKAWSVMRTEFYSKRTKFKLTEFVAYDEVKNLGYAIVKNANYSGPLNIDMRIREDDGRVYLIEVNPRFWARVTTSLIEGINYIDIGLRTASDEAYAVESQLRGKYWASAITPIFMAFFKGDLSCWRYIKRLSKEQIKYIAFMKYLNIYSAMASKVKSVIGVNVN